nr:MAG TPA: hypothetical protein [Caudoviricetes sp.]
MDIFTSHFFFDLLVYGPFQKNFCEGIMARFRVLNGFSSTLGQCHAVE